MEKEVNYRSKWLAKQVEATNEFVLDDSAMSLGAKAQSYEFQYKWGKIGVYVFLEIHGHSYNCSLIYK